MKNKKTANALTWKAVLKGIEIEEMERLDNSFKKGTELFKRLNVELASTLHISAVRTRLALGKAMEMIKEEFHLGQEQIISSQEFNIGTKTTESDEHLLLLRRNLFISFDYLFRIGCVIFYCSDTDKNLIDKIKEILDCCKQEIEPNFMHMLVQESTGRLSLRPFKIEQLPDDVIVSNYNDDFQPVNEIILKRLQTQDGSGIVMLHGKPGGGKTSYIRYLISKLKKRVIYLPTDLVHLIGTPEFIRFIADYYTSSLFIIEDCENLIKQRNGDSKTAISNLLNITDGLLGDFLHIQIICTFNAELATIDKALLRKGRLIARYEFKPLIEKKCEQILKKLNINEPVTKRMTLAELYNMQERDFGEIEKKSVGFITTIN
jgi:hypothetical protein